jgi:hypothetical protein
VRGNISSDPINREFWASVYVPGVGCFLEGNFDLAMAEKQASATKIRNNLSANGLTGGFEYGVKEPGTR